jgi:type IV fimbrial biogenesis protein FimT
MKTRGVRGFTLIELIVALVVLAILAAVAMPSMGSFFARKRVEGVATELATDLQYARSEAVQRNTTVRITFGTGCYVIHTVGSSATSCTQASGATLGTGAIGIKTVQLDANSSASLAPVASLTYVAFDSVRGMASWDGTNTTQGAIDITSNAGPPWQLRVSVTAVGRTRTCSPNGSLTSTSISQC